MTDTMRHETLLAVFEDEASAKAAADEVRASDASVAVDVGAPGDTTTALEAEMDAELVDSRVVPTFGPPTPNKMVKGMFLTGVICGAVGLLIGLPVGYFLFDNTGETWQQLVIGAGVGGLFFATVGVIMGAGLAVNDPDAPLAGQRGVTVRVDRPKDETVEVLERHHPIRLDVLMGTQRVDTPDAEHSDDLRETVEAMHETARDPSKR